MRLVAPTDSILLGKAEPVQFPSKVVSKLAGEMLRFMIGRRGCGLAAPQIGIPLRMFTFRHDKLMGVVINPTIIDHSPTEIDVREGCLTFPDRLFRTRRPSSIQINYQDLSGSIVTKDINGFMAIIWQHETDHLDGRLVTQHGIEE